MPEEPYDQIYSGGLFRCCAETIRDLYPDGPARVATQGQKLSCKYAPDDPVHQMLFSDGAWRWDHHD